VANPVKITLTVKGRSIARTQEDFNKALLRTLRDIGLNFKKNAILNTPIEFTPLRKSIKHHVIPGKYFPALMVIEASLPYAHKVHEKHDDAPGATFRKGKITLAQPGTPEGGAGGKYFERVSNYRARQYFNFSIEVLTAALEQRRVRVKLD